VTGPYQILKILSIASYHGAVTNKKLGQKGVEKKQNPGSREILTPRIDGDKRR
jgi:hypothetical protein